MANYNLPYAREYDGQMEFYGSFGIAINADNTILVDNTDGVYNGNILEFKLTINDLNKTLFQAIKYLSKRRIKGESVPATILLVSLNDTTVYVYHSEDYRKEIHKVYTGSASRNNEGFVADKYKDKIDYSSDIGASQVKKILLGKKDVSQKYIPVDLDEDCIVGWAERYYRENPKASKGDFIGDNSGTAIKQRGEIREPKLLKGHINPYTGTSNEKFKYLMDCLNDRLNKKDLGAFYTPEPYCKKAAELVEMAVARVPDGNDYIILDRCAGTGNLEAVLIGVYDKNGDELISHCVVSTYEYYEYKVLLERIGDKVRDIIPPTEANVIYANGKVANADAMSKEYIDNAVIRQYVDNPNCTIILFENPPYRDAGASDSENTKGFKNYVNREMCKETLANKTVAYDLANMFIWSGYKYYLRQPTDSYVLFSPIKYWKMHQLSANKCIDGYIFNRDHFHATASAIFCILWSQESDTSETLLLKAFDIVDNEVSEIEQSPIICRKVWAMSNKYLPSTSSFTGDEGIVCGLDGIEVKKKARGKALFNKDYFAYLRLNGFNLDALNRTLTTVMPYPAMGRYLTKDNYLKLLPLFSAKLFQEEQWYERDIYATTSDGGDAYTYDFQFLKSCLIYTCLSNQNKCLSFDGSDGRRYQNELCFDGFLGFDDSDKLIIPADTDNLTVALKDLYKYATGSETKLDNDELELLQIWGKIQAEMIETDEYNSEYNYGVYQITKELNTYSDIKIKGKKIREYDYPELNGNLETLRKKLKDYYKSHITDKMFKYELLK